MNAVLEHLTSQARFDIVHEEYGYRIVKYSNPNAPPDHPFTVKRRTGVGGDCWAPINSFETMREAVECLTSTKREMDAMRKRDVARASAIGLFLHGFDEEGRQVLEAAGHYGDASWLEARAASMRDCIEASAIRQEQVA